jgi:outer membrane receptor protein involved in Fe transport
VDRYNYVDNIYSEWVSKAGADIKAGINVNLNEFNNIYLNAGFFSMAPYFKFVFGNYNNIPTRDLKNEKVKTAEIGYGLYHGGTKVRINGYVTKWEDKSVLTNEYNQFEDPVMLQGLDALHLGAEGEASQRIFDWMSLSGMISLGNWKWKNDVSALLYNRQNVVVDTINVYADGLYVGDAPQFQAGLSGSFKILRLFDLDAQWVYYDNLYADFNPAKRSDPEDKAQPVKLPSYQLLDLHAGYGFRVAGLESYLQVSCYNVLNDKNIIRGEDGTGHNMEDFTGFWGFGRTFNFSLKISF